MSRPLKQRQRTSLTPSLLPLQVTMAASSVWQSCENKVDWIKILLVIRGHICSTCTKHTQTLCLQSLGQQCFVSSLLVLFQQQKTVASSFYPILFTFPVKGRVGHKPVHPHSAAPQSCAALKRLQGVTLALTFGCYLDTGDGVSFTLKEFCAGGLSDH